MSLQLILGSSGTGKSHMLYEEIIEKSRNNPKANYLIIVPEQFTLQTQKDIVSLHPDSGTMNIDILSFMRLALRIFDEVGGNDKPVLEDSGKSMILRKVVGEKKSELSLFHKDADKKGFIGELKSLISEIYQYSVNEEMLGTMIDAAKKRPMLKSKLHDILVIYKGFNEFLKDKYITAEEILEVLCTVIEDSNIIKDSIICLDGFTGFTPAQYKLLTILMKQAKKVLITLTVDVRALQNDQIQDFELFALTKKTKAKLEAIVLEEEIKKEEDILIGTVSRRFKQGSGLASIEKNLFRYPHEVFSKEVEDVSIHRAKDPKSEVSFVVREILNLVRTKGYRYQDIAIIAGDINSYGRILQKEMDKHSIPVFIDHKREILSNPFVELIRAALSIIEANFDYESVFRYLRCGLVTISPWEVDILENYVIALGIRGRKRYEEEWTRTYRGQDAGELILINEVRTKFYSEIQPLYEAFKSGATVFDMTKALYEFGEARGVQSGLNRYLEEFEQQNMLLEAKEYEQIYEVVISLYEKMVELLGEDMVSVTEYIEILDAGLMETKVGLIPPGLDPLVAGDLERTRLKDVKALFFIGVNDCNIPRNNGSGGILSEQDRLLLEGESFELAPTKRQAAFTEKFYLYSMLTKPRERLYISYSKLGEDGKTLRPSYLIESIKHILPKVPICDEEEMDDTKEDYIDKILSSDKGLSYLINGLRQYPLNDMPDIWKELYTYYYNHKDYKERIQSFVEAVFYVNREQGIGKRAAQKLFGEELRGSVTRFEKFAECAFAHFVQYGLELEERQEYKIAMPDIGNLFHTAIELYSRRLEASPYNWHTISDELRVEWTKECVREACSNYGNSIFHSSKRYEYIVTRVERITNRTLWALTQQIRRGEFEPIGFEVLFTADNGLGSLNLELENGGWLKLRGRIDRLDVYEEEDKLQVRVVDYKSGTTSFDLQSLYYGLQIQLALYMNAAMELMDMEYDKEIIPAGILYYNIDDPFVSKGEDTEEGILKKLKMNGIINSSKDVIIRHDKSFLKGEDEISPSVKSLIIPVETNKDGLVTKRSSIAHTKGLKDIGDHVQKTVKDFGEKILRGYASIAPYQMDKKSGCDYCPYRSICGFDTAIQGYEYRKLNRLSKEEIWERLKQGEETKITEEAEENRKAKENKKAKKSKEARGDKEVKENEEIRGNKETRGNKEIKENKETKGSEETKEEETREGGEV